MLLAFLRARFAAGERTVDSVQIAALQTEEITRDALKCAMEKIAKRGQFVTVADELIERKTRKGTVQKVRVWHLHAPCGGGTHQEVRWEIGARNLEECVDWLRIPDVPEWMRGGPVREVELIDTEVDEHALVLKLAEMAHKQRMVLRP